MHSLLGAPGLGSHANQCSRRRWEACERVWCRAAAGHLETLSAALPRLTMRSPPLDTLRATLPRLAMSPMGASPLGHPPNCACGEP